MKNVTAIILAAGKGTRMNSTVNNKVALPVKGQPMLVRTLDILKKVGIEKTIVVVGFAKESVISLLDEKVMIVEQEDRLGTAHAVKIALPKIPSDSDCILILYGDDAFLHAPDTYQELYKVHKNENSIVTFITMELEIPTGYGRILRDNNGNIIGIVEEKNATDEQKRIKEVNLGCYLIDKKYLIDNIDKIKKNNLTGEYYITDLIDLVAGQKGKISAFKSKNPNWRGINTPEDLEHVEKNVDLN